MEVLFSPIGFKQLLVILYKDNNKNKRFPGAFALINNKKESGYLELFRSIYNIITLEKSISILNRNRYSTNSEFLIRIIAKSGAGLNILDYKDNENNIEWLNSIQKFNKINNKIHLAQKPIDIINGVIKLNTLENDIVLDCFSGSGTTAVACHNLKRRFICIEKDYNYWGASVKRLKNAQAQMKLF